MLPGDHRPMLQRSFVFMLLTGFALVTAAPLLIAAAPYESTMGLIQKIFYFHVPSWIAMFTAITVCGVASVRYLATRSSVGRSAGIVRGGADRRLRPDRAAYRPALGPQGVGPLLAVGRQADYRAACCG